MDRWRQWRNGEVERRLLGMVWNECDIIIARAVVIIADGVVVVVTTPAALIVLIGLICLVFLFRMMGLMIVVAVQEVGRNGVERRWSGHRPSTLSRTAGSAAVSRWRRRVLVDRSSEAIGVRFDGSLDVLSVVVSVCLH